MNTEERYNDDRIILDNLSSICCNQDVIRAAQVAKALSQQARADFDRLKAIESEQSKLRSEYLRFLDLDEERKAKQSRLTRTVSLVPQHVKGFSAPDQEDEFDGYIVKLSDLALWEAMLAVLEATGEVQLFELQQVLGQFGKNVTRGAIESAVKTHGDRFRVRTMGRERLVSLKR